MKGLPRFLQARIDRANLAQGDLNLFGGVHRRVKTFSGRCVAFLLPSGAVSISFSLREKVAEGRMRERRGEERDPLTDVRGSERRIVRAAHVSKRWFVRHGAGFPHPVAAATDLSRWERWSAA